MLDDIGFYVAPLYLCYFIDVLFWIDFYFQARCYYYMQDGVLVTTKEQLWIKFREKYNMKDAPLTMLVELWCAFPLEVFSPDWVELGKGHEFNKDPKYEPQEGIQMGSKKA